MLLSDYKLNETNSYFKIADYLDFFLKIENNQIENTLKAFSYFITSNKNHKYNITHITDLIKKFTEKVELIKTKQKLYESVFMENSNLRNDKNECIMIVLDRCFLIDIESSKLEFVNDLSLFSLESFSYKNIFLQFKIKEVNKTSNNSIRYEEFSYKLDFKNKEDMINNGVKLIIEKINESI